MNTILKENQRELDYYKDLDNLTILTQSTAKILKENIYKDIKGICPILNKYYPLELMVLDHKHSLKNEPVGENGKGLVRGVINRNINALEGKILSAYKRLFGSSKIDDLPNILRNLANYLENPPIKNKYVHPSEKLKRKRFRKSDYKKIKKYWKFLHPNAKLKPCPKYINKQFMEYLKEVLQYEDDLKNNKIKKINKIEFKRILKYYKILYPRKRKLPEFPEEGIMDKELENLLEKVNKLHFK